MNQMTRVAIALGAVAFVVYAFALPPSFAFWDTGELQTVSIILGIAHPPACPAFVLLGWLFAHVVPFGERAWRVDLMCAFSVACSVGLLYALARRFGVRPVIAVVCTLGFAIASVTLRDATRAEVQDLSLALRALAFVLAVRFYDTGSRRALAGAALATGLAGATHGIALLLLPSLALLVLARREGRSPGAIALASVCIAIGLLPYAYLPLRSTFVTAHGLDPTVALGLRPGSSAFWDYDHPATFANFRRVVLASDFNVHSGFAGFVAFARYPEFAGALVKRLGAGYGIVGAVLAMLGFGLALFTKRADRIALVLAAALPVPYTQSYSELQDPDRYYLFVLWCAAIAIGLAYEPVVELLHARRKSIVRVAMVGGLVANFLSAAPDRLGIFKQRDDRYAARYVGEVRALVPDRAVVLADWAYATPLAYASYVRGDFGDRIVIAASPEQYASHYGTWLRTRPVYVVSFDETLSLPGYRCTALKHASYSVYRITGT